MQMPIRTSLAAAALLAASTLAVAARQVPQGASVDDAVLLKPAPGEWVNPGRDYAETHHSPLTQIDQSNVSRLAPAWSVDAARERLVKGQRPALDALQRHLAAEIAASVMFDDRIQVPCTSPEPFPREARSLSTWRSNGVDADP